ncbi:uncharacterized protein LOC110723398 isoform X2 [Chenopodium quinoa]|uniref:uncharacterized protein LOC110723398 isoform X2 n=1 Tax=Chenopodium quinoa TaxID=63459 RepID=UPI000B78FEAD|nr:uncharacterized protein LOC110723398 isoform X2 [Chenopodium quinoa]
MTLVVQWNMKPVEVGWQEVHSQLTHQRMMSPPKKWLCPCRVMTTFQKPMRRGEKNVKHRIRWKMHNRIMCPSKELVHDNIPTTNKRGEQRQPNKDMPDGMAGGATGGDPEKEDGAGKDGAKDGAEEKDGGVGKDNATPQPTVMTMRPEHVGGDTNESATATLVVDLTGEKEMAMNKQPVGASHEGRKNKRPQIDDDGVTHEGRKNKRPQEIVSPHVVPFHKSSSSQIDDDVSATTNKQIRKPGRPKMKPKTEGAAEAGEVQKRPRGRPKVSEEPKNGKFQFTVSITFFILTLCSD